MADKIKGPELWDEARVEKWKLFERCERNKGPGDEEFRSTITPSR